MDNQQKLNTEKWDDFLGNWLKADHVKVWPAKIPVVDVRGELDAKGKSHLIFSVELSKKIMEWEANKTNTDVLRKFVKIGPKDLIGKLIVFSKIKVRNPTTGQMVDSLLVDKVE